MNIRNIILEEIKKYNEAARLSPDIKPIKKVDKIKEFWGRKKPKGPDLTCEDLLEKVKQVRMERLPHTPAQQKFLYKAEKALNKHCPDLMEARNLAGDLTDAPSAVRREKEKHQKDKARLTAIIAQDKQKKKTAKKGLTFETNEEK